MHANQLNNGTKEVIKLWKFNEFSTDFNCLIKQLTMENSTLQLRVGSSSCATDPGASHSSGLVNLLVTTREWPLGIVPYWQRFIE